MAENKSTIFGPQLGETPVSVHVDQGFIPKGVVDNSTAQDIEFYGNLATEAHKGYQVASLQVDIQNEVDDFVTGYGASEKLNEPGGAIDTLGTQEGIARDNPDHTPEEKDALEAARVEVRRLARAKVQGAATPLQLRIRLETMTKQAINNMPGLAREFRAMANAELGDVGGVIADIESKERAKEKAAKSGADMMNAFTKKAWSVGVDTRKPGWEEKTFQRLAAKQSHEVAKNAVESGLIEQKALLNNPEHQKNSMLTYTGLAGGSMKQILENTEIQGNITEISKRISIVANNQRAAAQADFTSDDGVVSPAGKLIVQAITDQEELYTSVATGKLTLDEARNRQEARQIQAVASLTDTDAALLMYATMKSLGPGFDQLQIQAEFNKHYTNHLAMLKMGANSGNPLNAARDSGDKRNFFGTLINWAKSKTEAGEITDTPEGQDILTIVNNTLKNWVPSESVEGYDGLMSLASSKHFSDFLAVQDPSGDTKKRMLKISGNYIKKSVKTAFHAQFDYKTMEIGVAPDGSATVVAKEGGDEDVLDAVRKINASTITRFNTYNRANATLRGKTLEEVNKQMLLGMNHSVEVKETTDKYGGEGATQNGKIKASEVTRADAEKLLRPVLGDIVDQDGKKIEGASALDFNVGPNASIYIPGIMDMFYGEDVDDWAIIGDVITNDLRRAAPSQIADIIRSLPQMPWVIKMLRDFEAGFKNVDPVTGNKTWWNSHPQNPSSDPEAKKLMEQANAPFAQEGEVITNIEDGSKWSLTPGADPREEASWNRVQ